MYCIPLRGTVREGFNKAIDISYDGVLRKLRGTIPGNLEAINKPIERGIKAMFDAS